MENLWYPSDLLWTPTNLQYCRVQTQNTEKTEEIWAFADANTSEDVPVLRDNKSDRKDC